ncbi:hypothetical protein AM1_F0165 (plasmid) [Acaryochloris marina MBIC11017]|uniref:Uncharacterized protein n=2 Tax=Acaryochloris marina TaxID=155978 RepID=A8ZPV8_ACAM1|nr:hypothetical protein AM1_F0165 [Acaryochloris marina MBIC11017]
MKSKFALLMATAIGILVVQPAMAANLSSSEIDQMLQNIAIPIAMIASSILAIHIFSSGQLSYVQMRKQPGKIRELIGITCMSFALCSLPSLVVGEFGSGNVTLLLINGALIAFGLMIRSQ